MDFTEKASPLMPSAEQQEKFNAWLAAYKRNEKCDIDVYGKPTEKQLQDLERVRSISKELQDNIQELEKRVVTEDEVAAMTAPAEDVHFTDQHEFMSGEAVNESDQVADFMSAKEEEKQRLTSGKAAKSEIQNFYKDQCVFLTGGTGFLGKVLIEKLLRSCPDIDTIYVLIRDKRGKSATIRLHEVLDDFLFHKAREINPKGVHKVVAVSGDMEAPGLGLSERDRNTLLERVTVVLNAAATVRFDEKLSVAFRINVRGTREVIQLARECRRLRSFTHVSTAFSNTHYRHIEEKFYPLPITLETIEAISGLDEALLDNITPTVMGRYPNTYCFTKAVAEEVVRRHAAGMPVCVFRPSIVISTHEEPVRGWTDSLYGPTGLLVGIGTGVLRTMYLDVDKVADMVPVDLTVNAILATAWRTAADYKDNRTSEIPIYNFVSGARNPLTWYEFIDLNKKHSLDKPTTKAVWYYGLNLTNNYYLFLLYNFFLHYLPALLIDFFSGLFTKRRGMLQFYHKVIRLATVLFYFSTQDWKFSDDGVCQMWSSMTEHDRKVFPFNIADMSWDYYMETFLAGIRVYIVKDDMSTLPEARKKWYRLYVMHQILKTVVFGSLALLSFWLLKFIFSL